MRFEEALPLTDTHSSQSITAFSNLKIKQKLLRKFANKYYFTCFKLPI
jgi:hypothetical protein